MPRSENLVVLIDGADLNATAKKLGFKIDYKKMHAWLSSMPGAQRLLRAFYYTTVTDDPGKQTIRPLLDFLEYNGFTVITRPAKEHVDHTGQRKIKGSMDMDMAATAFEIAEVADNMMLFSSDGGFVPMVEVVQRRGVRVVVVSTIETSPAVVSDALRRQADEFIDLRKLEQHIKQDGAAPALGPTVS
jgi:uncharacterized LabA/DUF88 family protein